MQAIRLALIGDQSEMVLAHKAIPMALELAGVKTGCQVEWDWVVSSSILPASVMALGEYDCVWCVPGSPHESEAGALEAIRFARLQELPFLGTCGGSTTRNMPKPTRMLSCLCPTSLHVD